jgi:thioredoxin 1
MSDSQTKIQAAMHLNEDDFLQVLTEAAGKPVFVDFYAEWCGPCKLAGPIVDKLAVEYGDKAIIAKVDVDDNNELARQFGVMSIPTTIIFQKAGEEIKVVDKQVGFPGEPKYRQMLDQALAAKVA